MMMRNLKNYYGDVYCEWNPVYQMRAYNKRCDLVKQMMFQKRVKEGYGQMPESIEKANLELQG